MADKTTNLNLTKPDLDDSIELSVLNANFDIIDGNAGKLGTDLEDIKSNVEAIADPESFIRSAFGKTIRINDSRNKPLKGLKIYGRTEQGANIGGSGNIEVKVRTKNLINFKDLLDNWNSQYTQDGGTFTINAFGQGWSNPRQIFNTDTLATVSANINDINSTRARIDLLKSNGTVAGTVESTKASQTVSFSKIRLNSTNTGSFTISDVYISTKMPQSLTISTPNGLAGITADSLQNNRNLVLESDVERVSKNEVTTFNLSDYGKQNLSGQTIVISLDIRADSADVCDAYIRSSSGSKISTDMPIQVTTEWTRYSDVVTVENAAAANFVVRTMSSSGSSGVVAFHIRNVKVEIGNQATDWSPAPEDIKNFNYTDENGEQWISDEVNLGKGIIIKRIDNGAVLTEQVETPLSSEEIAAFKELHTNKPDTVITNDSDAYMRVEYVSDIMAYTNSLEARILALEAQINS